MVERRHVFVAPGSGRQKRTVVVAQAPMSEACSSELMIEPPRYLRSRRRKSASLPSTVNPCPLQSSGTHSRQARFGVRYKTAAP